MVDDSRKVLVPTQEQPCPRCANRRTVRAAEHGSFCFNCGLQWSAFTLSSTPHPRYATATFTPLQLARFGVYRAAVKAGFYTDWPTRRTDVGCQRLEQARPCIR
jgi:hypothetical protein